MLSSHSFSPTLNSSISQFAEMMVSGVLSSCPASVMNPRCRSMLCTVERTALPENSTAMRNTAALMTTATVEASTSIWRCMRSTTLASRNVTSVSPP